MSDRLVIVQTEPIGSAGGRVSFSAKTYSGLEEYGRRWPGEVVVVARRAGLSTGALSRVASADEVPFGLELVEDPTTARSLRGAAVVHAMHQPSHAPLLERDPRRLVWLGEFPLVERIRSAAVASSGVRRARATAGWVAKRRLLRQMVRRAGGFQSNGYPAAGEYGRLAPTSIVFFDTRVSEAMTAQTAARHLEPGARRHAGTTLRLAFSGRHIPAKGPEFAVGAVAGLLAEGADLTLDVFGDGSMTEDLRRAARPAGDRIRFRGAVPFEEEWMPTVREEIDIMLLPHVQGDPSGTYLEAAAAGAPVLGFANRALSPLVDRHGIGWTVPLRDLGALRTRIEQLVSSRDAIAERADAGLDFMSEHAYPREFARRVDHLRDVAGV